MNWKFWQSKQQDDDADDDAAYRKRIRIDQELRDGCRHDWTNWENPVPTSVKSPVGIFGGSAEDRDMLMQSRRCIKCNLGERRYH